MNKLVNTASIAVPSNAGGITIKSADELKRMRRAGQVVALTLQALCRGIKPGMNTMDLDQLASQEIERQGALPAFKGYQGFPATICVSINEEIVHGIPSDRIILEGDLVKMDVGATVDGFIGDAAITVGVGECNPAKKALIDVTRLALEEGILAAKDGARIGDISWAIQNFAETRGYHVVREYVGHGIGRYLHEEPQVPNCGAPGRGPLLRAGMVIAIEPMVNIGTWRTEVLKDNWTVVTEDRSLSAHFEHTIAITPLGPEVLTRL